ncbi:MAG: WYL domain-containing protein [Paludibacteraceae bacterium]|nr:WYL domain-containing protein [Paludibacteraceae bacterium]
MSPAQVFKVYIWLIDTISSGHLSKEDIDRRWAHSAINEYGEQAFPARKFHRYKEDILILFGINIRCNRSRNYYYIDSEDDLHEWGDMRRYVISAFTFKATLDEAEDMQDSILFESIPEGTQYLTTIMRAIRARKQLLITYHSYDRNTDYDMFFSPYCLRVFKQRWYVVGEASTHLGETRVYALDRICDIHALDNDYSIPAGFSPKAFFSNYYGVFRNATPCLMHIEASPRAALFLRSLPLHASQRELPQHQAETFAIDADSVVFEYFVAPTLDFIQQLRTFGAELRVLDPLSLAKQMQQDAQQLLQRYTRH